MATRNSTSKKDNHKILPLISLDSFVVVPKIPQPIKIDSEDQLNYLDSIADSNAEVFFATERGDVEGKPEDRIMKLGVVCFVDKIMQVPGAPTLAFVRPVYKASFEGLVYGTKVPMARITPIKDVIAPKRKSAEAKFMMQRVEELFKAVMQYVGEPERSSALKITQQNALTPIFHLYAMTHVAPISWEEKYLVLQAQTYIELLNNVALAFDEAEQKISLQASIQEKTHHELSRQQKENFLRVHLRQVKEELGESEENEDIASLVAKAADVVWDEAASQHFNKELQKLKRLNINNPEYSIQYAYLENLLELPWNKYSYPDISLDKVEEILNRDHFGLEKVKERILEYMAVVKLRNDLKAPILCLYGPPGVGKTSIGKSVAEAVGREYARIALGGMHDEAEIRGHRRTYIGAMPGRFLHTLSKCKYGNPLILLDEIDKVGKDFKGDPSSALLEALDPEQNNTFHDNFIDYPYDLSKVLFIATANDLSTIPPALRDRMEVIEMKGYTIGEKREIALRHLVKKALTDNGLDSDEISFSPEAIDFIIRVYTHEKGVRQLAKTISRIIRKIALRKVKGISYPKVIKVENVKDFLDKNDHTSNSVGFHI